MDQKKSCWKGNVKSLLVIINDTAVKLTTYTLNSIHAQWDKNFYAIEVEFSTLQSFLKFHFLWTLLLLPNHLIFLLRELGNEIKLGVSKA